MKSLLVVGLDGGTFDVLDKYVEQYEGGPLARIRRAGVTRVLNSTLPYFTGPAWTTFMTGLRPDQHGVYHWRARYDTDSGDRPLISTSHLNEATYWWYLQQHGGRVCVTNFPMIYPAPPTEGVMICGTLSLEDAPDQTWPPQLAADIRSQIPSYRFEIEMGLSLVDQPERLSEHILQVGADHLRATTTFGRLDTVDLAVHVVTVTDRMQHFFWVDGQPSPQILAAYRQADTALQTLLSARQWDNVIVVSDHGAGPSQEVFYTDQWLVDRGWAHATQDGDSVEIPKSLAYAGEEPEVAIYVNLIERDGYGIAPTEYEPFLQQLRNLLLEICLPGTNTRVFEKVLLATEQPDGGLRDLGPDIMLIPTSGIHPRPGLPGATFGQPGGLVSGHRIQGLFMASGTAFRSSSDHATQEPMDMAELFAVMCAAQGIPIPAGIPSERALRDLNLHTTTDSAWHWPSQVDGLPRPQSQSPDMTKRLRELGYL